LDSLLYQLHPEIPTDLESLRERVGPLPAIGEKPGIETSRSLTIDPSLRTTPKEDGDLWIKDSIVLADTTKSPVSITVHNQGKTRRFCFRVIVGIERF
jgi:hypothetical protein